MPMNRPGAPLAYVPLTRSAQELHFSERQGRRAAVAHACVDKRGVHQELVEDTVSSIILRKGVLLDPGPVLGDYRSQSVATTGTCFLAICVQFRRFFPEIFPRQKRGPLTVGRKCSYLSGTNHRHLRGPGPRAWFSTVQVQVPVPRSRWATRKLQESASSS